MELTNEDVADILAVLDSLPYDELDLQTPRFRLTLRRVAGGWTQTSKVLSEPAAITPAPNGSPAAASAASGAGGGEVDGDVAGLVAVMAPLPGTFYRAPRPGAAPFVEVGDPVSEDTVVAIVETMKLMNSVHAGVRGRVAEIRARNGEPTAQGATLMRIAPEG
jgi:acetyl-CoA carboxylase biotin carboxyl carrier protein